MAHATLPRSKVCRRRDLLLFKAALCNHAGLEVSHLYTTLFQEGVVVIDAPHMAYVSRSWAAITNFHHQLGLATLSACRKHMRIRWEYSLIMDIELGHDMAHASANRLRMVLVRVLPRQQYMCSANQLFQGCVLHVLKRQWVDLDWISPGIDEMNSYGLVDWTTSLLAPTLIRLGFPLHLWVFLPP